MLYKGRHSSVFACTDGDGQPVVLKCYHKALLERRHHRNVRREIDAMQTATEHRRAAALLTDILVSKTLTQPLPLHNVPRSVLHRDAATHIPSNTSSTKV